VGDDRLLAPDDALPLGDDEIHAGENRLPPKLIVWERETIVSRREMMPRDPDFMLSHRVLIVSAQESIVSRRERIDFEERASSPGRISSAPAGRACSGTQIPSPGTRLSGTPLSRLTSATHRI
jgi:hypothetical protein